MAISPEEYPHHTLHLTGRLTLGVDSLTHALVVSLPLPDGLPPWFLFGLVLGAVIPDIDIFFKPLSDRYPRLFILTHGGFTHSIGGAATISGLSLFGIILAAATGATTPIAVSGLPPGLFIAIFAGTLTHLLFDSLAYPGIPILYPVTPRKFTLGIFPGPSVILFAVSILAFGILAGRVDHPTLAPAYLALFSIVIFASAAIRCMVRARTIGALIPTFHPLRWLVISEDEYSYTLGRYDLRKGLTHVGTYQKFSGVTLEEITALQQLPEVQRHRYYSYIVTAGREEGDIILRDPLRKDRVLFYPPYYTEVIVSGIPESPRV